jgi:hypothetical protein
MPIRAASVFGNTSLSSVRLTGSTLSVIADATSEFAADACTVAAAA